ncbi:MAG: M55 family metallopeptidase, partial [Candidatus Aminicenantes bacterium]|nr:M55 family metallopeptidase [Candidatus Aminicenantes bacterium]
MKKNLALAVACALVLLSSGSSQQKPLKVLVLYDMEGVSGASSVRHTDFGAEPEYTEARKSLTADVNAAIAGLKAAGATEIVVVDGHGSGNSKEPDVLEAELLAPAKMISRDRPFDIYMDSYDQSFDAVVAVAMHAGAGNPAGFLSHTYTIEDVQYRVNGTPFNETMILAMGAARFGIPLIMVSGDDQFEKEIKRYLPWVKYAAGKKAMGRTKAEPFAREDVSRRIEKAAREALLGLDSARQPEGFPGPSR